MKPLSGLTNTELRPNTCSSDASDDAPFSSTHIQLSSRSVCQQACGFVFVVVF